jgi:hypothetical protein
MAPGHNKTGLSLFYEKYKDAEIPVYLSHVDKDTIVVREEMEKMVEMMINYKDFTFIPISSDKEGNNFNHRIHRELVELL